MRALEIFKAKKQALGVRSVFNAGAGKAEIKAFEAKIGARLPEIFKEFYALNDGGFFADDSWSETDIKENANGVKWNSNHFLSLSEILQAHADDGAFTSNAMPVMQTSGQELLAMRFDGGEILDAFHELPPQYWNELYSSFEALLLAYAENEGALNTIA